MAELQTRVLLLGTSEQNLNGFKKIHDEELSRFHVQIAENSENALFEISKVKIVVFVLENASLDRSQGVSEASEGLNEREISLIRCLTASKSTHLRWIFVGALDSKSFQTAVELIRSEEILRWRYLKAPLLANELSIEIKSMLEEEILADRMYRSRNFEDLRSGFGGLAHEFANLLLRVISRADLAQLAANEEKRAEQFKKLAEGCDAAKKFTQNVQKLSQEKFRLSAANLSICIEQAVRSVREPAKSKKVRLAIDLCPDEPIDLDEVHVAGSFHGLLEFLIDTAPEGGEITISTRVEFKKGEPGILISFSGKGDVVSESTAKRAIQFGHDFRLPTAKQIAETHGGTFEFSPGSHPLVLIWLPARLYAKT